MSHSRQGQQSVARSIASVGVVTPCTQSRTPTKQRAAHTHPNLCLNHHHLCLHALAADADPNPPGASKYGRATTTHSGLSLSFVGQTLARLASGAGRMEYRCSCRGGWERAAATEKRVKI